MKHVVVLGVTGSIAAYKAAELCGELTKRGCDVNVIMTESATRLVTPQTFLTLSRNPVITSLWGIEDWRPGHIALADKSSILVIAPCTANLMGKMANGIADDALSTYYLTHTGKTIIAPAMNPKMWKHPAVTENAKTLKKRGVEIVGPASGRVACGDNGIGRMEKTEKIITAMDEK
ncbi:MAG: phosphopantothenoylcysteine decarboxylase [Kiritimatiellaeota bacterium]|nr:phosphopantothenoylcysteine decarboxylase [Kiritimatiellota bacterium]